MASLWYDILKVRYPLLHLKEQKSYLSFMASQGTTTPGFILEKQNPYLLHDLA
ncbi:hypothetical protein HAX54_045477, partial [Datura stramonium]|nr:hypothetical protein [Datura stramonium]